MALAMSNEKYDETARLAIGSFLWLFSGMFVYVAAPFLYVQYFADSSGLAGSGRGLGFITRTAACQGRSEDLRGPDLARGPGFGEP